MTFCLGRAKWVISRLLIKDVFMALDEDGSGTVEYKEMSVGTSGSCGGVHFATNCEPLLPWGFLEGQVIFSGEEKIAPAGLTTFWPSGRNAKLGI